jgi:LmbE family N-acetylglucosaminyl deacetylase
MAGAVAGGHVVLSPHPDDAVWSVGGRIARWRTAGEPVTVLTVFDGPGPDPPLERAAAAAVTARRTEDDQALASLGVRRVSVGLPDAILRADGGIPRYPTALRLFGRLHPADLPLLPVVAAAVRAACGPAAVLHSPLAAGRHVDHVLVRRAADLLRRPACPVHYYEDFPYRLRPADHAGLSPGYVPVDLAAWLPAARSYHSQAIALFGTVRRFELALAGHAGKYRKEAGSAYANRVWTDPRQFSEKT